MFTLSFSPQSTARSLAKTLLSYSLPLCSLLLANVALAKDITSSIESVIVYPEGAMITRTAAVDLTAGETTLNLVGLVGSLSLGDVQVQLLDEAVEIGQVSLNKQQQRDAYNESVKQIKAKITDVEQDRQMLADSSAAAKLRLKFIESVSQGYAQQAWTDGARGSTDITSWNSALSIIQSGSDDANQLIRRNKQKQSELNKTLSKLKRELSQARGVSLASSQVEVTVAAKKSSRTKILLHYFQRQASWQPIYEARLDSDSARLILAQQAIVSQTTDEDWSNVALTLSTSEPSDELTKPELFSEVLNLYDPSQRRLRKQRVQNYAVADSVARIEEVIVESKRQSGSIAEVGAFAVNYNIPGKVSVPNKSSDDLSFDLSRDGIDVELVTQIVPRESTEAFLAARFTYQQDLPMYAGDMRVFVDGVYVGISGMPSVLPQAEVTLPMGQDRRVLVSSRSQVGQKGKAGLISKRITESVDYLFEITNRRAAETLVEVFDRYPVARNKAIEIDIPRTATEPSEKDVDKQPGVIVWRKPLAAGEKMQIQHQYTVSYPDKFELETDYE